jgi:hypothetical protein
MTIATYLGPVDIWLGKKITKICKIIKMTIANHSTTVFITLYVKVTGADKDKLFLVSLGALMTLFT